MEAVLENFEKNEKRKNHSEIKRRCDFSQIYSQKSF